MNKYYFHAYREKANHAGSKAVDDCEKILYDRGYTELTYLLGTPGRGIFDKFQKVWSISKIFNSVKKNSIIVIEHPLYISADYLSLLFKIKKTKNAKLIFIIHDLEIVRKMLQDSEVYEERDKRMFKIADIIIAHNLVMKELLIEYGVDENKIISLEIFDYLVSKNNDVEKKGSSEDIVVAGNLDPKSSGYVYKLNDTKISNLNFNLYGVNYIATEGCNYYGSYSPDELPHVMNGKYGLIWYGSDLEKCGGILEDYIPYINPHKTSAYIAAGLPVIMGNNIGLKSFIESNKLGFCIDSLLDIQKKIREVSDEQYNEFKENVYKMGEKLKNGYYLNAALNKAEQILEKENS